MVNLYMGVSKKVMVPPNHPFLHRVFHFIHHPFWVPLFLETSNICLIDIYSFPQLPLEPIFFEEWYRQMGPLEGPFPVQYWEVVVRVLWRGRGNMENPNTHKMAGILPCFGCSKKSFCFFFKNQRFWGDNRFFQIPGACHNVS